ncbi:MAG: type I restriction endonuclease subunit R [Myxococcales bacterium]|nr:type I restriction endonuclease subunit R [Myxococcales bacterium]
MKSTPEKAFESAVVAHLTAHGGYLGNDAGAPYDDKAALVPADLLAFVQASQPAAYAKLKAAHPTDADDRLIAALQAKRSAAGTLGLLHGRFDCEGVELEAVQFPPSHEANQTLSAAYAANRLRALRQVHHDPTRPKDSIDLVLCVNGLPWATVELKSRTAGWSAAKQGQAQYAERDGDAPLLRFRTGALVHFAVDDVEAWMTTRLAGKKTRWLPFNRGDDGGKGNALEPGEANRTVYLWRDVWARDAWLGLFHRFVFEFTPTDEDTGKKLPPRILFPRFHQWDAVNLLLRRAREDGPGRRYLVQHSAGSGKSNTIGWLAHHLAALYTDATHRVFDKVVVVSDRVVLDGQLQDTVRAISRGAEVACVDAGGEALKEALAGQQRIIVTTLQKFAVIEDVVDAREGDRFAVIIDEAHSSQGGELSRALNVALRPEGVEVDPDAPEARTVRKAKARQFPPNLSLFAFTATPHEKTLELFGEKKGEDAQGKPIFEPTHLYGMRQAIEEGFIRNALEGYVTFERFFKLTKKVDDDPTVDQKKAIARLRAHVDQSPKNLARKAQVIVDHFVRKVKNALPDDQARAMVITNGRRMALRMRQAIDAYVKKKGYVGMGTLVAFSGSLDDEGGTARTESYFNGGLAEDKLPARFRRGPERLLVVADKYQTGFDEPRLVAMYVDKPLAGRQAVQTLSRLNRIYPPHKDRTFVLDFVNDGTKVHAAFQRYYECTRLEGETDASTLEALRQQLDAAGVYTQAQIDAFTAAFDGPQTDAALEAQKVPLQAAYAAYEKLAPDARRDFRRLAGKYRVAYRFVSMVVDTPPPVELEARYWFLWRLTSMFEPEKTEAAALPDDAVDVNWVALRKRAQQPDMALAPGQGEAFTQPGEGGGNAPTAPPVAPLSAIVELINQRYGGDSALGVFALDAFEGAKTQFAQNPQIHSAAKSNPRAAFVKLIRDEVRSVVTALFDAEPGLTLTLLGDNDTLDDAGTLIAADLLDEMGPEGA